MKFLGRSLFVATSVALALSSVSEAAPRHRHAAATSSWNGKWAGAWGGRDATAITISANKVVSYEYGGATNPVSRSRVTAKRVVYGDNGVTVTLIRTSATTASAKIHTDQGDGAAILTRQ